MVMFRAVTWVSKAMAVLVLALWMPATLHCELETMTGLGFLACCSHTHSAPHQDADCDEDACATVESGLYQIDESPPLTFRPLATLPAVTLGWLAQEPLPPKPAVAATVFAPPELDVSWQFSSRAALPPRAPSFIS